MKRKRSNVKKRKNPKFNTKKVKRRGGNGSSSNTTMPIAVQSYPLAPGTSSQRESAMQTSKSMNAKQQSLINKHGGGRNKKSFMNYRGGNSCSVPSGPVVVPSFSNSGSKASPVNANTTAALSNSMNMQSGANACNDCYATGTCKGGGKTIKYYKSRSIKAKTKRKKYKSK